MRFLIDDERDLLPDKSVPDMIARTFLAGEIVLGIAHDKDEVWVDHDLGEINPDKTGYRLLTNFEEYLAYMQTMHVYLAVPRFHSISSNPPGRKRIEQVIDSIERLSATTKMRGGRRVPPSDFARLSRERSAAPWRKQNKPPTNSPSDVD